MIWMKGEVMQRKYRFLSCICLLLMLCSLLFGCQRTDTTSKTPVSQEKEIIFGGDLYPPFVYFDDKGDIAGIDIDIMREASRRLGYKATYKVISWNNKDELFARGDVDGLWSCFSMNGREELYAWAGPYLETHHVVVVGRHSNIKKLQDLNGRRVIVQYSSQPEKILLERKTPDIPEVRDLYSTNNVDSLFSSLQMGYADACATNEIVAQQYQNLFPGDFVILKQPLLSSHIGVAFPKEKAEVAQKFHTVLLAMQQDGTTAKIIAKYTSGQSKAGGVNGSVVQRKKIS